MTNLVFPLLCSVFDVVPVPVPCSVCQRAAEGNPGLCSLVPRVPIPDFTAVFPEDEEMPWHSVRQAGALHCKEINQQ